MPDADFADRVHASLPYAWHVVSTLVTRLEVEGGGFADNSVAPSGEAARGKLLGAMAGDAIRGVPERYFGVRIAFRTCHRVVVFPRDGDDALRARFASMRAQLLNQAASCATAAAVARPARLRPACRASRAYARARRVCPACGDPAPDPDPAHGRDPRSGVAAHGRQRTEG